MQKIKTGWYNSGKDDSSNGGIESKVVLGQVDFAEVEEVADALDAGEVSTQLQVDHNTESDHQQGVAEEPEDLENRLFVSLSEKACGEHGSEGKHNEVDEASLFSGCFPVSWRSGEEQAEKQDREKNDVKENGEDSEDHHDQAEGHDTKDCEKDVEWEAAGWDRRES